MIMSSWWSMCLRGLCAVIFGILAFSFPGITLGALVFLFGGYTLADGVLSIVSGMKRFRNGEPWGIAITVGVISTTAGVITFLWPGITALTLLFLIAGWAMAHGITEIFGAFTLPVGAGAKAWLGFAGLVSVALGVLMAMYPGAGALAVVTLISAYAIIYGASLIGLSFAARHWRYSLMDTMGHRGEMMRPGRLDRGRVIDHRRRPSARIHEIRDRRDQDQQRPAA